MKYWYPLKPFQRIFLVTIIICTACAPRVYIKGSTVAIWDLDDLSPSASVQSDLGMILSSQVIETLQKKGDYTIVEREQLLLALEELYIGTTSLADESTRLRLGKLVGARFMIFGGYHIIGDQMRLDLRMVEVDTGKIMKAVHKTAAASDLSGWLDVAIDAAEELL